MSNFINYNGLKFSQVVSKVILSVVLLALSVFGQVKNDNDVRLLTIEQPIERELKDGETHSYTLALQAGQFLKVVIEQKGIDVVVAVFDSENKKIADTDISNGTAGFEPLALVIETTGNYRIEVRPTNKTASVGRYEAKIKELRAATDKDKNWVVAKTLFDEAMALYKQGKSESLRSAIEKFETSLPLFRALEDGEKEADIFNNIGLIYDDLGDKQRSLKYYNEALLVSRRIGNKQLEAVILSGMGKVYSDLGDKQKALEFQNYALLLRRAVGDKRGEALTLNNIGRVYSDIGDKQQALKFYNEALPLRREVGDKSGEAQTLNNIGTIYMDVGEPQQALKYFNEGLLLFRALGDKRSEAGILNNIGRVYDNLGENELALKFYNEALPLFRSTGNKRGEATILQNIGVIYSKTGDYQQALKFYNESLPIRRAVGDKSGEATLLNSFGLVYFRLGDNGQALKFYNDSLPLRREVGDRRGEAGTLNNIAEVYFKLGDKRQALKFHSESLPLARLVGNKSGEGATFKNMFDILITENPRFAIFYGKQSVNNYQTLRSNTQELDKNVQQTFLKSVQRIYYRVAESLIKQQRYAETQQVLNAFKDQQFFDFSQNKPLLPLAATDREAELTATLNQKLDTLAFAIRASDNLKRTLGNRQPTSDDVAQLKSLTDKQTAANDDYLAFLKTAEIEFSKPLDEKDKVGEIPDLRDMQATLREISTNTKQKAAAVYQLVGEENFHLLVITADEIKSVSTPVKNSVVNEKALDFWALLQSPVYDPNLVGKELYDVVFKPLESVLPKDTKTIVWALDGNLRYVPMAALFDGKQYLAERFNHVNFTRADKERMTRNVKPVWTAVGFGTSEAKTVDLLGSQIPFEALPGVGEEFKLLFKPKTGGGGIFSGDTLQNAAFNKKAMLDALKQKRPLVHIASHFSFRAGDEARSFLLLGDGTAFTLADMKRENNLFEGVELLTLSACNTAAQQSGANGREVDGFAELAQRLGANSVMATLWSVADCTTPWLMREFYNAKLNKNKNKAESLREAQIGLITGKSEIKSCPTRTDLSPIKIVVVENETERKKQPTRSGIYYLDKKNAPLWDKDKHPPFAHPFYWSPFILFGNWK